MSNANEPAEQPESGQSGTADEWGQWAPEQPPAAADGTDWGQAAASPPPPPPPPAAGGYASAPYVATGYPGYVDPLAKSKIVAGLLGIFLGGLGIHRFYLGFNSIGIIQIIVTIVTCGVGAIWGFVEGILYLVGAGGFTADAEGRPLRD